MGRDQGDGDGSAVMDPLIWWDGSIYSGIYCVPVFDVLGRYAKSISEIQFYTYADIISGKVYIILIIVFYAAFYVSS